MKCACYEPCQKDSLFPLSSLLLHHKIRWFPGRVELEDLRLSKILGFVTG